MKIKYSNNEPSIIKVIGVGGGGSNAVNHMFKQGIIGVDFAVCNTDQQSMFLSPVPTKIQLGPSLTEGRGAGSKPIIGKEACLESIEEVRDFLSSGTKMLFITAGMGGGTGTGAAPVIAKTAQEMDILTVAIVTLPFMFEGRVRGLHAIEGLTELKNNVDTIIIISNDKLRAIHGNLSLSQAFSQADNVLTTAAKGIAEIITVPGYVNVDFEDVNTVMRGSGVAVMGTAQAEGPDRARRAVETALNSPLLEDNDIRGAQHILLNITSGKQEVTMDEVWEITEYVQEEAGDANLIWGNCYDESLGEKISVTLIATGFETGRKKSMQQNHQADNFKQSQSNTPPVKKVKLEDEMSQSSKSHLPNQNVYDLGSNDKESKSFTFDFDINKSQPIKDTVRTDRYEPYVKEQAPKVEAPRVDEKKAKLRELSNQLHNPTVINEMENVPAYLRRNVPLDEVPHSSSPMMSKFSLNIDEDGPEFRENNSFLHDNVD